MHVLKAYRGSRGIAPLILNLCTKWWWAVSFVPHLLPPGRDPPSLYCIGGCMCPGPGLGVLAKGNSFLLWIPNCPALSL